MLDRSTLMRKEGPSMVQLEELFPPTRYPLRAKTEYTLPERHLTIRVERYYQNPYTHIANQESGLLVTITLEDFLPVSFLGILHPDNEGREDPNDEYYLLQDKALVPITLSELENLQDQLWGAENLCKIVHLEVNARWESF